MVCISWASFDSLEALIIIIEISLLYFPFVGIEIAMTYKYGNCQEAFNIENRELPHFEWIGLSRFKLPK